MSWLRTSKACGLALVVFLGSSSVSSLPPKAKPASQVDYAWDMMCSQGLRPIARRLKGHGKRKRIELKDTIEPCTKHVYQFSGSARQKMRVWLADTEYTWIRLFRKDGGPDWEDGRTISAPTREWEGALTEKGQYRLLVVTTKSAPYTLNLKIQ